MFRHLRIRTGLMLVLGIFSLALWSAVFIVWTDARQSARAMEDVVGLSDREIQPLQDTERLFLSTLIHMDNAYINLVRGDQVVANDYARKASASLQQAKKAVRRLPRLTQGGCRFAGTLGTRRACIRRLCESARAARSGAVRRVAGSVCGRHQDGRTGRQRFSPRPCAR